MTSHRTSPRSSPTPFSLGFRMPAEWEPHAATWLAWPHRHTDWPGKMGAIHWDFAEIVRAIVPGERVRLLVGTREREARARRMLDRLGVDLSRVDFLRIPTDRSWMRDSGPIFVRRDRGRAARSSRSRGGDVAICRFRFNAWAYLRHWRRDDAIPEAAARHFGLKLFRATNAGRDVVLEGGSIDVNGRGSLLTTEECLLHPTVRVRNPGLTRDALERVLRDSLGVTNVLWLGRGLAGDDTHGHVDDIARFADPRTIVAAHEDNPKDDNYVALSENLERLRGVRLEDGSRPRIVTLPMPAPLWMDGRRLPGSYANFYIANAAVLVPTFNDPADRTALGILSDLFPDRRVVGIHAVNLVWGGGTLHCLSQQEPSADATTRAAPRRGAARTMAARATRARTSTGRRR